MAIPAAQYLRMSTEHQQYSLANQAAAIAIYAKENGFFVARTYKDAGRSGLNIKNRPGLASLLRGHREAPIQSSSRLRRKPLG
jgi:DNA invertase Pin-like site-specific DNA recombinase